MSLSKPEVAAYVGISSAIGLALAYFLAKEQIIEKNRPVRDSEEGKQVGKQVTLKRKKTGTDLGQFAGLANQEIPQEEGEEDFDGFDQRVINTLVQKQKQQAASLPPQPCHRITQKLISFATPLVDTIPHLVDMYNLEESFMESPLLGDNIRRSIFGGGGFLPKESFMPDNAFVIAQKDHRSMKDILEALKVSKAGPRQYVFFNPKKVRAAIVTCGGLCPGLNVVIRELVMTLHFNYEAAETWGVHWGFKGLYSDPENWMKLEPKNVKNIQKFGGSVLGSSRGGFDADKILDQLEERKINQLYCIGGDGTHRGIHVLLRRAYERKMMISFVGIPKTIDNDIPIVDYSFGFNTACEVADRMIQAAFVEATSAVNGVGLVKLMGRHSGFIARNACIANANVDFCLIPELPFELRGPKGLFSQIAQRVKEQKYCVIVVAEGAEEGLVNPEEKITKTEKRDKSDNLIFDDIGKYLKLHVVQYVKEHHNMSLTLKYIDPTYAIRSCRSNAVDTILCAKLAQNAIHGAMAGYTGFSVGIVRNAVAWIPINTLIEAGPHRVSVHDRSWQRLMAQCRQKHLLNEEFREKANEVIEKAESERKVRFQAIIQRIKDQQSEQLNETVNEITNTTDEM